MPHDELAFNNEKYHLPSNYDTRVTLYLFDVMFWCLSIFLNSGFFLDFGLEVLIYFLG